MSQRLFNTAKVPVFIEGTTLGIEKRKDGPVSVVVLGCKVQPFDAKMATSLDGGVGADSNIRSTAFNLNNTEPKQHFTRHDFRLGIARQRLECFATPDTQNARVALDGVRIYGTYVRSQKDMPTALALIFKPHSARWAETSSSTSTHISAASSSSPNTEPRTSAF